MGLSDMDAHYFLRITFLCADLLTQFCDTGSKKKQHSNIGHRTRQWYRMEKLNI
jgi:hypothetical protein